jgi:hypothetical protein
MGLYKRRAQVSWANKPDNSQLESNQMTNKGKILKTTNYERDIITAGAVTECIIKLGLLVGAAPCMRQLAQETKALVRPHVPNGEC